MTQAVSHFYALMVVHEAYREGHDYQKLLFIIWLIIKSINFINFVPSQQCEGKP